MNFSAWAIRNPVPPILAFILVTVAGLIAFGRLEVQYLPDLELPIVIVSANLDGTTAEQLEVEVARKIEDSLTGLDRLESITTSIDSGQVLILASFKIGKDSQTALDEVKNAVEQLRAHLPAQMQQPIVSKSDLNSNPLVTYILSSNHLDEAELSWLIDNDLQRALMKLEGVGEVNRLGGLDREIRVELNADRLQGLGLTANDINTRLLHVQKDTSGGKGQLDSRKQTIRVSAAANAIEDLRAIPVPLTNGGWISLNELGEIKDTHATRKSLAYLNGEPVIAAQIKRSKGYSDIAVADYVRNEIDLFAKQHPEVTITEAYNTVAPARDNYESSMHMLYEGAILAVFVVFLFLRDWRATFLAAIALPLSIIPTFIIMDLLGYSLNLVTLMALSLVVGVLVDDAIVEIENIQRHLKMGKSPYSAAMEAADEIGLAVIATTLALVAVFLPTAFLDGISGLIFKQFGITASVAILCSLAVARLITPMMAAYLMAPSVEKEGADGVVMLLYMRIVKGALRNRWIPVLATIGFMAFTLLLVGQLSTGFFPAPDNSQTQVTITTPPGSTIEQTDAIALTVARAIKGADHVTSVFQVTGSVAAAQGSSKGSTESITSAMLIVNLTPIESRNVTQSEIEAHLQQRLSDIPGASISVGVDGLGTALQLTLAGENPRALDESANRLEAQIRGIPGIGSVTSFVARQNPEIVITPDLEFAASLGITPVAISEAVRVATTGAYDAALAKLNLSERQLPIRVQLADSNSRSIEKISLIPLSANSGTVTLGTIAEISLGSAPSEIARLDRSRNVAIKIDLNGRNLSDVMNAVKELDAYKNLPTGITFVEEGELKRQSEMFTSFATAMALGIFCIYAVLVILFHDFLQPITILMALPLALGGALLPLVVSGGAFTMPAVIGFLLLMGIVTKNSILLVEYTITARAEGMNRFDALVDACRKRARPIIMTTIAMAGGMAPAALSLISGDPSFRQTMGVVVIGGLITSTFLSLIVIPVTFTFVDDFDKFISRFLRNSFQNRSQNRA